MNNNGTIIDLFGNKGSRKFQYFISSALIFWSIGFIAAFYLSSTLIGNFNSMHKYGHSIEGQNYVYLMTRKELLFYIFQIIFGIPAIITLSYAFLKILKNPYFSVLKYLRKKRNFNRCISIIVLLSFIIVLSISLFIYNKRYLFDDEIVYLTQARIMKSGKLFLNSPEDSEYYSSVFMVNNGKWFGQYPFGYSLFLLAGLLLGLPYLTNAIAAAISVYLMFRNMTIIVNKWVGLLSAILLFISPFFMMTSSLMLSHTTTILFLLLAVYAALKALKDNSLKWSILFGIFWGISFHIRGPVSMLLMLPLFIYTLFALIKKGSYKIFLCLVISSFLSIGSYFLLNYIVNASPFITNYHAAWLGKTEATNPFGFGKKAWGMEHTPYKGLVAILKNMFRFNFWLFGSAFGFVPALFTMRSIDKKTILLFLSIIVFLFSMFFYFWPGASDTGPVLYIECIIPFIMLSSLGIYKFWIYLKNKISRTEWKNFLVSFFLAHLIISYSMFWTSNFIKINYTLERSDEPYSLIKKFNLVNPVIFMYYYVKPVDQKSWRAGKPPYHPYFGKDIPYILNLGKEKSKEFMKKQYPDRTAWVFFYKDEEPCLMKLDEFSDIMAIPSALLKKLHTDRLIHK